MKAGSLRIYFIKRLLWYPCRQRSTQNNLHYGLEKKWTYYNQEAVDAEASKHLRLLTPTQIMFAGRSNDGSHLLKSSQFLQIELPRRIARRVQDFQSLPYVVALNPTLQGVYELYLRAFDKLSTFPPITTIEHQLHYSRLLSDLLEDHKDVVTSLAKAFHEVKNLISYDILGSLTERTLTSRLGIRLLAENHIGLQCARKKYIGVIYTDMSPKSLIERCVYNSKNMCEDAFGHSPAVYVSGHTKARFPHIPGPIEYILHELLKNSMKAVVVHHRSRQTPLPPIEVTICNNEEDFIIRISDRGGGIPDSAMKNIFKYSFSTTAEEENQEYVKDNEGGAFDNFVRFSNAKSFGGSLSGYGFGLPSSKAYSKFLGGSLEIMPMYGLGTDAFLRLSHISKHNCFRI